MSPLTASEKDALSRSISILAMQLNVLIRESNWLLPDPEFVTLIRAIKKVKEDKS